MKLGGTWVWLLLSICLAACSAARVPPGLPPPEYEQPRPENDTAASIAPSDDPSAASGAAGAAGE